jgi:hypothetical protein
VRKPGGFLFAALSRLLSEKRFGGFKHNQYQSTPLDPLADYAMTLIRPPACLGGRRLDEYQRLRFMTCSTLRLGVGGRRRTLEVPIPGRHPPAAKLAYSNSWVWPSRKRLPLDNKAPVSYLRGWFRFCWGGGVTDRKVSGHSAACCSSARVCGRAGGFASCCACGHFVGAAQARW